MSSPAATPGFAKLNLVQRVMALWEEVHPYNVAVVFRLRGRATVSSLQAAIQMACRESGIGKLVLDRKKGRYSYEPVDAIDLGEIRGGDSPIESLWRAIAEDINRPFPNEPHHPVRWRVLDDARTHSHFLVAIFRHLAADGASICLLSRRVLEEYYRIPRSRDESPLDVYPPGYAQVMRHHFRRLGYFSTLARAARRYFRMRCVYRLPEAKHAGEGWDFSVREAPHGLIGRLVATCRERGVTVNEAFLASLSAAIAAMTPLRRHRRRRRALALAHVVNVREEASADLSNAFGVYLGESVTIIDEPDTADFDALLRRVVEDNRLEKAAKRFVGPQWNFVALLCCKRWIRAGHTRAWYRKVYPLSACLSNVRLNPSWFGELGDRVLGWIAMVPPGPALPILVVATTVDDHLNVCLAYRRSCFTAGDVRTLLDLFFAKLELLAGRAMGA